MLKGSAANISVALQYPRNSRSIDERGYASASDTGQPIRGTAAISIIIPTYNRPAMLARAALSVRAQSRADWELIIVDDRSEPPIGLDALGNDNRIRIIRMEANGGPARARNCGIQAATADWIGFLDDDDELHPEFIRTMLQASDANSAAAFGWCGANLVTYDEGGNIVHARLRSFRRRYETHEALCETAITVGIGFGFVVRRSIVKLIGALTDRLALLEDTEFILRLLSLGHQPVIVPEPLVTIHNHRGSRRTGRTHNDQRSAECELLLAEYSSFMNEHPRVKHQLLIQMELLKAGRDLNDQVYIGGNDQP